MPKRKPSQVITHRIELQETERAALEAAMAGRFVTNAVGAVGSVFSGVGSVLAPFAGAFTAIAALWIGDRALDEVMDAAQEMGEQQKQQNLESYSEEASQRMQYFAAMLRAYYENGGFDNLVELLRLMSIYRTKVNAFQMREIPMEFIPIIFPPWWGDICFQFLGTITQQSPSLVTDPVQLWSEWITLEEYQERAYWEETEGKKSKAVWKTFFG